MNARRLCALLLVAALADCQRPEQPAVSALSPLSGSSATALTAPARINGYVGAPEALPPSQVSYGRGGGVQQPAGSGQAPAGDISLNFADTDIREVVAQILGNILRVNYAIDPSVHGTATLRTVTPLSRSQLVPTLEALLAQNGAALVRDGNLYRVVPAVRAVAALGTGGTAGSVVVPLHFASADELARVLQPYVGFGGRIVVDPGSNALLVSGDPESRDSLVALVQSFDTNILAQQSYALFPVNSGDAKDFAGALEDAMRGQKGGSLSGMIRIVPLSRINAVLVISPQPQYIDEARRLYALVTTARQQTTRSWHVDYLQDSRANDIAYILQQAFTPDDVTAQPTSAQAAEARMNAATGGGVGGLGGYGAGGAGGMQGGLFGGGAGAGGLGSGINGAPGATATIPPGTGGAALPSGQGASPGSTNPLLGPLEPTATHANADTMRIIPDQQNNAILIYGTQREVNTVEAMLRKLDILPLQVRIDAVIAEVELNDNLQYGTQFFFRAGGLNGILSNASQTSVQTPAQAQLNLNFPGFFLGGHGLGGAPFAINALQAVTKVRVLSSPELLVLDGQPARLQVGDVVPYLSQTSQSTITSNAPVVSSINYQQTGVVTDVTPHVNSSGLVTLDILQDVSDVSSTLTTPGLNSPTFEDRNVTSRVVVQDGQTVGLAGLISDNTTTGNQGIPWLKDVPLLGLLAGNQNNTRQRTELLVMITPHVVHDQRDARELTEDMRDQLINAAAVPDELNGLRPSGSSDPGSRLRQQLKLQQ
jgi:general secretion pathway protein D